MVALVAAAAAAVGGGLPPPGSTSVVPHLLFEAPAVHLHTLALSPGPHAALRCRMSSQARRRSAGAAATPTVVAAAAAANDGVQGEMLDAPSTANKNLVRFVAVAGAHALLAVFWACCTTAHAHALLRFHNQRAPVLQKYATARVSPLIIAVAATVAAAARGTAYLPTAGIAFVHLLSYAVWLGAIVWTTFIAGGWAQGGGAVEARVQGAGLPARP